MDSKMNNPKNIHIALVKKEDIEKDKNKRIIKTTKEWDEVSGYVGGHIYDANKKEIFKITEVTEKKTLKKDGMFSVEYWEIDYAGEAGLSKGRNRRVFNIVSMSYDVLRRQRLAFLELLDEFEEWEFIKKK